MHPSGQKSVIPQLHHDLPVSSQPSSLQQATQAGAPILFDLEMLYPAVTTVASARLCAGGSGSSAPSSLPCLRRSAASRFGAAPSQSFMMVPQSLVMAGPAASAQASLRTQVVGCCVGDRPGHSVSGMFSTQLDPTHILALSACQLTCLSHSYVLEPDLTSGEAASISCPEFGAKSAASLAFLGKLEAGWLELQQLQTKQQHCQEGIVSRVSGRQQQSISLARVPRCIQMTSEQCSASRAHVTRCMEPRSIALGVPLSTILTVDQTG